MKVLGRLVHLAILGFSIPSTIAFASLQSLLTTHQDGIASLKEIARTVSDDDAVAPTDDVFYLRYVINDYADDEERVAALKSSLDWRVNEGNAIVTGASKAIAAAMESGKWNNDPIQNAAPHAELIKQYLQTPQCITTSNPATQDLVYCIRAGKIDDNGLMAAVSIDNMVDFFLYCKEVNSRVADIRSVENDKLIKLITCNDLAGVKLLGGSSDFRTSLSNASKKANALYPSLNGRTLMLNPPKLLGALVKVFTKLLPKAVTKRLRFESGPLKDVEDLREIAEGGKGRDEFLNQVNDLAYDE